MINRIMKNNAMKSLQKDLDRLDRTRSYADVSVIAGKSYIPDDTEEHKLDVYYVADGSVKPVLIDIHGGGFISEDKELDCLFCNFMAHNGYVVFSINYRLAYPDYTVFDQIIDVDAAVKWIADNAQDYEGNKDDLHIAGHSAGAVLAVAEALLCRDKKMKADSQTLNNRRYLTPPHPFKQRAYPPPTEAKRFLWRMREPSAWGWSATREVGAEERKYSCLYHLFHIKRLRI